jgi:hypothetical protein
MANFHTGSSTEPLVDADVVNGTQIKTVEYQCHVLGGVELPWAEHGERVISRCSKQFVYGVILRNPQSVQEVRLNHHNPSITEPLFCLLVLDGPWATVVYRKMTR